MRNPLRLVWLPALFLFSLILGACSCSENDTPMSHFEGLIGSWSGIQTMAGDENKYQATYKVSLTDGTLVHEFASNYAGGFTGTEKLHFDVETKQFVAEWIDSMQPEPSRTTGHFDVEKKELTMTGTGPDFADPNQTVKYLHFTQYGDQRINYTMSIIDDQGVATEVMWIKMTKDA
jgi:uncharacterized protein DUF1579